MNAIILAAGMGMRLRPLTNEIPKALVKIGSESFFERQLRLLRVAGITDITVVTGYKAEAFRRWHGEPGLCFVHNDRFQDWNNLFSMYLVRQRLADTVVLDGDVWIADQVLPIRRPPTSRWYVGYRRNMRNEWLVRTDQYGRVQRIDVASGAGWILTGISFWTAADGPILANLMHSMIDRPDAAQLFWDDAPRSALARITVVASRLGPRDWAEVDTVAELAELSRYTGSPS
jgi:CTP:phosphocholine cytidylyltransferase-like protein